MRSKPCHVHRCWTRNATLPGWWPDPSSRRFRRTGAGAAGQSAALVVAEKRLELRDPRLGRPARCLGGPAVRLHRLGTGFGGLSTKLGQLPEHLLVAEKELAGHRIAEAKLPVPVRQQLQPQRLAGKEQRSVQRRDDRQGLVRAPPSLPPTLKSGALQGVRTRLDGPGLAGSVTVSSPAS